MSEADTRSRAAGAADRIRAQGAFETRTLLRNGEQLLVSIVLPAMALAAPFAALQVRSLVPYLLLSSAFALTLIQSLLQITLWRLDEPLHSFLISPGLTWAVGLVLLGAAVTLIAFVPRGRFGDVPP